MKPKFGKNGNSLPCIVQDARTLEVLTLGQMDKRSYRETRRRGFVVMHSKSKPKMRCLSIHTDCDGDAILIKAIPSGVSCHKGKRSCFDTEWLHNFLFELESVIETRWQSGNSRIRRLRRRGVSKSAQKVIEEAGEAALASVDGSRREMIAEVADLIFHLLVLLRHHDLTLADVAGELRKRHSR